MKSIIIAIALSVVLSTATATPPAAPAPVSFISIETTATPRTATPVAQDPTTPATRTTSWEDSGTDWPWSDEFKAYLERLAAEAATETTVTP
jgi:hypothetical protein